MPEEQTKKRARQDKAAGKAPSTQAGEFVREEIDHVREGKHGARSTKQAIAIGLSKARRAGVDLPPPKAGISERTRKSAKRDAEQGRADPDRVPSARRSRASRHALEREPNSAATPAALSRHAHASAQRTSSAARSASARKAVLTKQAARSTAARKAARTRRGTTQ
jgi:hypothetical protein